MTPDKTVTLQECAMRFGTLMGIFWILKFILIPLGFTMPFLQLLFILLTLFVPILGYIYARRYRERYNEGTISFGRAYTFTLFLYVFASILTAAAHYIYFRFLDNGYILSTYESIMTDFSKANIPGTEGYVDQIKTALDVVRTLTPIEVTMQLLTNNVLICCLLSLPTALLTMRQALLRQ